MNHTHTTSFAERELAALNARADALSLRDDDWEEAIDWGVPDCPELQPIDLRMMTSPDFDD